MAKIPLILNPEAPKGSAVQITEPRTARFEMPGVRYQEAVDYTKHIPGLMGQELSGRPFAALASAQMGVGQELQRAGAELGSLVAGMQRSKDASDISRVKAMNANVLEQFNEKVAAENVPISQQGSLWQSEFEPKIDEGTMALQPSRNVMDRIGLENDTFKRGTRANIWDRANKEQIKSDFEAMESDYKMSIEEGDYEGAGEVVERMVQAQAISKGRAHEMLNNIKRAHLEGDLAKTPPREGLAEMIEIEEKGESDVFGKLKPELVKKWKNDFQGQINDKTRETYQSLKEHKDAGLLTSPEDVVNVANGNLTDVQVKAWQEAVAKDPPYDEGKAVQLRSDIRNYDASNDKGLKIFDGLHFKILREVPDHLQGVLISELNNEAQRVRKGKEPERMKELTGQSDKLWLDFAKQGFLDPPGYDSAQANAPGEKGDDYVRKHFDEYTQLWAKTRSRQDDLRKWIETKGADNVTWDEITKKIHEMAEPDMRDKLDQRSKFQTFMERAKGWFGMGSKPAGPTPAEVRERLQPSATPGYGYPASSSMKTQHTVGEVTSYRPGATRQMGLSPGVEGGDVDAHGNKILGRSTMEDYQAGKGHYVTVAMDKRSPWQGKYLRSSAYPNVVFKVMDNGGYGNNRTGLNWIDIAWTDPDQAKRNKQRNIDFEVITAADARAMAAERGQA